MVLYRLDLVRVFMIPLVEYPLFPIFVGFIVGFQSTVWVIKLLSCFKLIVEQ